MTAEDFRGKLKALGISQKWLAGRLGVAIPTVNRWAMGTYPVPQYAAFVLELLEGERHFSDIKRLPRKNAKAAQPKLTP